jgi:flagellar motor switch/type III secretory pathway protein FliN
MASAVAGNPAQAPAKVPTGIAEGLLDQGGNRELAPDLGSDEARWRPLLGLPCQLTVDLPLPSFTIADLLRLKVGSVMKTSWRVARDVPLRVNETLIGWSEFEAVGNRLAVRLTELA